MISCHVLVVKNKIKTKKETKLPLVNKNQEGLLSCCLFFNKTYGFPSQHLRMEGESKSLVPGKLSSPSCSPPSLSSSLGNTGREEGADHIEPRAKLHPVLRQRLELQAAKGSPTLTVAGRWSSEPESHPVSLALPSSSPLKMEFRSLASSFPRPISAELCSAHLSHRSLVERHTWF